MLRMETILPILDLSLLHYSSTEIFTGELQSCVNQEARHSCLAERTGKNACPPDFAVILEIFRGDLTIKISTGKLELT
jgi:hypothetical protein